MSNQLQRFLFVPMIVSGLFFLSACADNSSVVEENTPTFNPTESPLTTPTEEGQNLNESPEASNNDTEQESSAIVALSSEGLQVVIAETGSTRELPFEMDLEPLQEILTNVLGEPEGEMVTNSECPVGELNFINWKQGLTVNLMDNQFVGWSIQPDSSEALTTLSGIGIGSTLAELQEVYEVEVWESSLGIEFYGSFSGLLSANQPDGVIRNLWAGVNCIFR